MLTSSFIALEIAAGMGLLSLSSQEEIATVLCGAIAIISFILSLAIASWQTS
jgi:multisubunit Na+/H+ antiporter MnhF subunit